MGLHVVQLGPIPPPEGGISRNILAIRNELLKRGDRCSIIATSRSTATIDDPDLYYPGTPARLLKILTALDFDVLHLHIGGHLNRRVMMLAAACAISARGRSVLTVHSGEFAGIGAAEGAKEGSLKGQVFRGFSRLIAVNEQLANIYQRFGVPTDRIQVITPFAPETPDPKVVIPNELVEFAERHSEVVLWVGGMERDYDPITAISAFALVRRAHPTAGMIMVGGGSMSADVRAAVAEADNVEHILLAGNVEHAVTLRLMQDAEVILRTTLFDGDAISVREGLFLGTPVVASDTGNRPRGCRLFKIGDPEGLSSKIMSVIDEGKPTPPQPAVDTTSIRSVLAIYDSLSRHDRK
ncbi:MAG: glycosyltransferase family 4 protein [Acidobacteria bacterium]|nr:glycosyltransferase family 4 protein [Acidobacteriota bacterium]